MLDFKNIQKALDTTKLQSKIKNLERENQKLKQENIELKQLTLIDPLTGIANRRYLKQILQQEYRNAMRHNSSLGLIAIDLDKFKQYNDSYGHLAGDRLLIQVANLLQQELQRPKDMLFRYGGEEFTCLLPNTTLIGVEEVATKLLKTARNCQITISVGAICVQASKFNSPLELLEIADRAMYQAKNQGRDRLVLVSI